MNIYTFIATVGVCFVFLSVGIVAFAQTQAGDLSYTPLEPGVLAANEPNFGAFLNSLFRILFVLGALIAVARMVIGGIMYMTSEVVDTKTNARKWMTSSLWGLLILAGSWLILYTINPNILTFSIGGLSNSPTTGSTANQATAPSDTSITYIAIPGGEAGSRMYASICSGGASSCDLLRTPIVYNPATLASDANMQMTFNLFKTNCESSHYDQQKNMDRRGRIETFPGELVKKPGYEGAACVLE